jgi:hypothetical protein
MNLAMLIGRTHVVLFSEGNIMKKSLRHALVATSIAVVLPVAAQAVPVELTYTGQVTFVEASLTGLVSVGDTFSIAVVVDNGGATTISQTWSIADTISAVVTAGTYVGNWTADFYTSSSTGFTTDATGALTIASWFGTFDSPSSIDSLGTGARLFNGSVEASNGDFFNYSPLLGNPANWTDPVIVGAPVPLPAAGWLMLAGLGGLAALRRAKRAAA